MSYVSSKTALAEIYDFETVCGRPLKIIWDFVFIAAYCGENPDIINHQSIMREYGTLGRMPREQPPPYQDFLGGNPEDGHQQILIR